MKIKVNWRGQPEWFDARRIGQNARFLLRAEAVSLFNKGYKVADIAKKLVVHKGTVYRWLRMKNELGKGWAKENTRGRRKGTGGVLSPEQEKILAAAITEKGPENFGLPYFLWSINALKDLSAKLFGEKVSGQTLRRFLLRNGFHLPRAMDAFKKRNGPLVSRWKRLAFPGILQRAFKENARIHWGYEAKLQVATNFPHRILFWTTNRGKFRFITTQNRTAEQYIQLFERLLREVGGKVYFIHYRFRIKDRKILEGWIEQNKSRFSLILVP